MAARFTTRKSRATLGRILAAAWEPKTVDSLAFDTGLSLSCIKIYARHLRKIGKMHIGDWGKSREQMLVAGQGKDVPYVTRYCPVQKSETESALVIRKLMETPGTITEIAHRSGYQYSVARRAIRWLQSQNEACIVDWRNEGAQNWRRAIYGLGPGPDKKYVSIAGQGLINKVAKLGDIPVPGDGAPDPIEQQQVKVSKAVSTGRAKRDPFAAAMFGEYRGAAA